eukprot:3194525-Pyramimonas_sp.AAC.1
MAASCQKCVAYAVPNSGYISGSIAMCFGQSSESTRRLVGAFPADEEHRARSSVGHGVWAYHDALRSARA